ncbi:MAG TPA: response regulator [Pyrinomonadaceae bacterium]|nr:response regulator [Pyrinomonadaceae bacterium]
MTRTRRILIVGNDDGRRAAHRALDRVGFDVVAAANHAEAHRSLLGSRFDLVVTEVGEPASDGVEFIKRIRATPQLADMLILVIAEWGAGKATLALSQGADGYEPKPVDANRLITSIERLLRKEAAAASQGQ